MTRSALAAIVFGVLGTLVLIGLGVWQLQRLEWKQGIIAALEARLAAEPVPVPAAPDADRDAFLRVRAEGSLGAEALYLLTSLSPWGPGFRVIAPLTLDDGRRVLADLGYVPEASKGTPRDPARGAVVGALYWPDEIDSFTPPPDLTANIWFARDLAPMAAALATEPLLIVAESHPFGEWPKPQRLGVDIPNDHLQYALTWFALALVWAVMSGMLVGRERRRAP